MVGRKGFFSPASIVGFGYAPFVEVGTDAVASSRARTTFCYRAVVLIFVLAVALSIASTSPISGLKLLLSSDQHFGAEDDAVNNAVPIPGGVWSLLKQDADVQEVLQHQNPPLKAPPRTWFSAAVIHLHGASGNDLVVQGEGRLMGANVTEFWVFTETPRGPKLVLKIPAHDLAIRDIESGGYKIIEASAVIAGHVSTLTYKFDGNQYILYRRGSD
jgi:hypothetical protein